MKVWKEYGSSHSADITIIGQFENQHDAANALPMIKDLIFGHEQGVADLGKFYEKWKANIPMEGIYLREHEFNDDPDSTASVEIKDNIVMVKNYRSNIFEGVVKLMFMCNSKNIQISGTPN